VKIKWRKVAIYGVGGFVALHVVAILGVRFFGARYMAIDGPNGIDEAFFATIRGREEHIRIRGEDKANPVVLILHGGPGSGSEPGYFQFRPYERTYTLATWDQPGAGRTFRRAGDTIPRDLTVEDVVDDGIAVAEVLKERLNVDKLILLGWSWGSVVGVGMAQKRPDLFAAYVGTGQLTSIAADNTWAYERAMSRARETGNAEAIADLERLGPWPYDTFEDYRAMLGWQRRLDGEPSMRRLLLPAYGDALLVPRYSFADARSYARGYAASLEHFFGSRMDGPEIGVDLPATATEFDLPIIFIQGENDLNTPAALAKAYFEKISAPHKVYVALDTGHAAPFSARDAFIAALDQHVRPFVPPGR
jgi:pimeloyl-ACP methyl ester carboxylesterase